MCSFEAPTLKLILSHLRTVHANDPNFSVLCGIDGCARSFKTFSAFYSHIYRSHKDCGIVFSKSKGTEGLTLTSTATADVEVLQQPQPEDFSGSIYVAS